MGTKSKYAKGFGERMRYLRRSATLKQDELAEKLDITRQSISGYETERLFPSIKVIEKMCDLYSVNPWWLLYGVGNPSPDHEGTLGMTGLLGNTASQEQLTPAQQTVIEYVMANRDAARSLAKVLWDKALSLIDEEELEESLS